MTACLNLYLQVQGTAEGSRTATLTSLYLSSLKDTNVHKKSSNLGIQAHMHES